MFGTVRPHVCVLPTAEKQQYRELYCGTCRSLGDYQLPLRALTSYDAVLLAAIVEGLSAEKGACGTCRCPLAPWVHKPVLRSDTPAMRVAAAVQLLLADAWLEDQAVDGALLLGALRNLVPTEQAANALRGLGLSPDAFATLTARQVAVEAGAACPVSAAEPTATLIGSLLAGLVDLPGIEPALSTPAVAQALGEMGFALGQAIYLIDALEDVDKDAKSGAFNPILVHRRREASRIDEAVDTLNAAVITLSKGARRFPWTRNSALLHQATGHALPGRAARAITAATQFPLVSSPWWRFWASDAPNPETPPPKRRKKKSPADDECASAACCECCGEGLVDGCCSCENPCTCINCCECASGCDCPCDGCG